MPGGLLSGLLPAVAATVTALAVNAAVTRLLRNRSKQMQVRLGNRNFAVTVPVVATDEEVVAAVESRLRLEERVRDALDKWRRDRPGVSFREGASADFVVSSDDRKVAVEVAAAVPRMSTAQLLHYADREGADAVLVVSFAGHAPSPEFAADAKELPVRVAFVGIPAAGSAASDVAAALDRLLAVPAMA